MTTISNIALSSKATEKPAITSKTSDNIVTTTTAASLPSEKSTTTISTLASQLAYSADISTEKNSALSDQDLAKTAKKLLSVIIGDQYWATKKTTDQDIPKTSDPKLLARAKQATDYLNNVTKNFSSSETNPFSGLSREQLSTIIYDQSGTFTTNERRAAYYETSRLEEEWSQLVVAKSNEEYNSTGKLTSFFGDVLEHFNSLPKIEQVQYPKNYANDLIKKIEIDFNYLTGTSNQNNKSGAVHYETEAGSTKQPLKENDIEAVLYPNGRETKTSTAIT